MPIKRPDIYEHNNPNDAFVDTDFVRGGTRTTANTINDLYSLNSKTDQLKEYATKVYVVNEEKYYILKDINNVDNIDGWVEENVVVLSNINNFSATTISATTYLGLPLDIRVTGGTYNAGTATFTNNTGGTFSVTGFPTGGGGGETFTGGTVTGPTIFTNGLSANTFSATTYLNLPIDVRVTGGTYNQNDGTITLTNNTGGTFSISGFFTSSDDIYTTGLTFNNSNYILNLARNDGSILTANLSILSSDMTITGGTYDSNTGIATFTNNSGGTFSVSGFLIGYTDTSVTGLTFNNNLLTLKQTNNNDVIVLLNNFSGLTVNGVLSATTYQNLPLDITITGGTYSSGTTTLTLTNNTGGTINVTGFTSGGGGGGITPSQATGAFGITIDGLGGVISSGEKGYVYVPYNATITGWSIFSDVVGDCVVDVWKDSYGNFPPVVGDSIAGTEKPRLTGQRANRDLTLSSWNVNLSVGDVIGFNVEPSPTGVTRVNLIINVIKT